MADAIKVLGQSDPAATTLTTLYTVPGATSAVVSTIVVANRGAAAGTFRVAVRPAGAAIADQHYIFYDVAIPANSTFAFTFGVTLATTDVISVYSSTSDFAFNAFGIEVT